MIQFNPESGGASSASSSAPFSVSVIGIGGSGTNIIDKMALEGMPGADLVSLNCDARALNSSMAPTRLQLGKSLTQGLGCGGDPELGTEAAMASLGEIQELLKGRNMVFLCVGLGGGTGSGAAPTIARLAREAGAFVVVFAMLPFSFEGRRRSNQAAVALQELREHANALVTFENDRMGELVVPKKGVQEAFELADKIIGQSVRAVTHLVTQPGLINIGMDDLITALRNTDSRCLFGYGQAKGESRAVEALALALKSPLLDRGQMLEDARNVLVHICGGTTLTLFEIETLMRELGKHVHEDAQILFGAATDARLAENLSVTILTSLAKPVPVVEAAPEPQAPQNEPEPAAVDQPAEAVQAVEAIEEVETVEALEAVETPEAGGDPAVAGPRVVSESGPAPVSGAEERFEETASAELTELPDDGPAELELTPDSPEVLEPVAATGEAGIESAEETGFPGGFGSPEDEPAPVLEVPSAPPASLARPAATATGNPEARSRPSKPHSQREAEPMLIDVPAVTPVRRTTASATDSSVKPERVEEPSSREEPQWTEDPEDDLSGMEEAEPVRAEMPGFTGSAPHPQMDHEFFDELDEADPEQDRVAPGPRSAAPAPVRERVVLTDEDAAPPRHQTAPPSKRFVLTDIIRRDPPPPATVQPDAEYEAPMELPPAVAPAPVRPSSVSRSRRAPDFDRLDPIRPIPAGRGTSPAPPTAPASAPYPGSARPAPSQPQASTPLRPIPTQQQTFDERLHPASNGGRFERAKPTVEEGEDLDVPTFLRRKR